MVACDAFFTTASSTRNFVPIAGYLFVKQYNKTLIIEIYTIVCKLYFDRAEQNYFSISSAMSLPSIICELWTECTMCVFIDSIDYQQIPKSTQPIIWCLKRFFFKLYIASSIYNGIMCVTVIFTIQICTIYPSLYYIRYGFMYLNAVRYIWIHKSTNSLRKALSFYFWSHFILFSLLFLFFVG